MNKILMVIALVVAAVSAESIRETETMDPAGIFESFEGSGSLPDDEDIDEFIDDDLYPDSDEYDSFDEISGSGDSDEFDSTIETPTVTMGNRIPEDNIDDTYRRNHDLDMENNEILLNKEPKSQDIEPSNEIVMASTGDFFQRTEVVVALIAGGLVGLLFAVFIIVFLYIRGQRKPEKSCDPIKKPIYTKAPTSDV
ncbi:syndecan 4-B-like [Discoglossus pictus]